MTEHEAERGKGPASRPVSSIRNLGPASDAAFARAGIRSAGEVHALGPDKAYARLLASGTKPHFSAITRLSWAFRAAPGTIAGARKRRPCASVSTR